MTPRPSIPVTAGRPFSRLVGFAAALTMTAAGLLAAGEAIPGPPASVHSSAWSSWLDGVGPAGALMAGVRLAGLAITLYLLVIVALHLVSMTTGMPDLVTLTQAVSAPWAHRLIRGVAGLGVATSVTATALLTLPAGAAMRSVPVATVFVTSADADAHVPNMHRLDPGPSASEPDAATSDPGGNTAPSDASIPVMRALDPDSTDDASPDVSAPTTSLAPLVVPPTVPPASSAPPTTPVAGHGTWTITPGDHLWGIAARSLAGAWHRAPNDHEIARYVSDIIEANRSVLVVPGDGDLVLPGQVFTLPPAAAP